MKGNVSRAIEALVAGMILGLFVASFQGCVTKNTNSNTNVLVNNNNPNGPSGGTGPGSGPCPAADALRVSAVGGGVVKVNEQFRLDLTAFSNGVELVGVCANSKNPVWAPFTGPCVYVTSQTGFNPEGLATATGTCAASVSLDGQTAPFTVKVQ